jgi:hypothetical protein
MARIYSATGWRTLEANGESIASGAFAQADDNDFSLADHGESYPHLELELVWTHGTAPTANSALFIYAQSKAINTANDQRPPSANHLPPIVAQVRVDAVTTTQAWRGDIMKAPTNAAYWLQAVGTSTAVAAGWTLRARAFKLG